MKKATKKPAQAAQKAPKKTQYSGYASFEISGTVQDVYEGKNANYVTVRVYDSNGYYTDIQITVDKEYEITNGEALTFYGVIKRFYNKERGFSTVFSANDVDEVGESETPFK